MPAPEGFIALLAKLVGSSEPAVRLLLSGFSGYPIAFFHRRFLYGELPTLQYAYFILTGLSIGWFNFGIDVLHNVVSIAMSYGILLLIGAGSLSLFLVFVQSMLYLLVGYWFTETDEYDILWTMSQCVITLRLIGLAFNLYDGTKSNEKLSPEDKAVALREMPGALEVFAHNFFPFTFLVGPQMSLVRMRDFVNLKFQKGAGPPDSIKPGLRRAFQGVIMICLFAMGHSIFNMSTILSDEFRQLACWKKLIVLGTWVKIARWKYSGLWIICEASCIILGVAYNGEDDSGEVKWDGCRNVNLIRLEAAKTMREAMFHFNISTNRWINQYIYRRLKFMNNTFLSHICVLAFLAVWHGFHSGYYVFFAYELLYLNAERKFGTLIMENPKLYQTLSAPSVTPFITALLVIYRHISIGFWLTPYYLFTHKKYLPIMSSVYFVLPIGYAIIIAVSAVISKRKRE